MDNALERQGEGQKSGAASASGGGGGGTGAELPPGASDMPFVRDDFLASTSITIAALTIQRAIVSFVLQEIDERGSGGGGGGGGGNVEWVEG